MKLIEAVIRPTKIEEVKEALSSIGVNGMTVTDVRGYGRQRGRTERYRGNSYIVNLLPKIKLEFVVPDELADEALEVVLEGVEAPAREPVRPR